MGASASARAGGNGTGALSWLDAIKGTDDGDWWRREELGGCLNRLLSQDGLRFGWPQPSLQRVGWRVGAGEKTGLVCSLTGQQPQGRGAMGNGLRYGGTAR